MQIHFCLFCSLRVWWKGPGLCKYLRQEDHYIVRPSAVLETARLLYLIITWISPRYDSWRVASVDLHFFKWLGEFFQNKLSRKIIKWLGLRLPLHSFECRMPCNHPPLPCLTKALVHISVKLVRFSRMSWKRSTKILEAENNPMAIRTQTPSSKQERLSLN